MSTFTINFSFAAYLFSLLGFGAGYISRKKTPQWIGFFLIAAALSVQTIYLGWRWIQGNYAPMSNMYESLLSMVWFVSLIYFSFFVKTFDNEKRSVLLGFGFWVALLCLILLAIASLHDRSIQSLMPALQSNWLLFHVATTMLGYASFALAFLFSVVYLTLFRKRATEGAAITLDDFCARTTALGFLFLTIGIILGSVWANSAWGSYWSWDPKETWSLITWFFYAVALHLRKTRGWKNEKFAWLSIGGFAMVLFTYFGVNYILSGLHSYA